MWSMAEESTTKEVIHTQNKLFKDIISNNVVSEESTRKEVSYTQAKQTLGGCMFSSLYRYKATEPSKNLNKSKFWASGVNCKRL